MHVTRVELDNIKAYERAEFAFARGTTAIVGPNGAGKTTILEAVAWSLFDVLDYSKDDFLRRGAKKGSVRVTFQSDVDERQYTVYRDTGNGYYVHDPVLNAKIAEKKQDVSAFLRQHLGIEPGTDLQTLFRSAIGVPQGTLTADFLKPASQRKAAFDGLLKVEEYREGAKRLGDTMTLIRDRVAEARERIGRAEGTLTDYDQKVAERQALEAKEMELTAAHAELQAENEQRARAVEALDAAERRVAEARALAERSAVELEHAQRRARDLGGELAAALAARARRQATEADHGAHVEALAALEALEAERAERDRLRAEHERNARLALTAEADARRLADALAASERARAMLAGISADVTAQEEAERERERLRELRARSLAARERLGKLDADLAALRAQLVEARTLIKQAEGAGDARQHVSRLESERLACETELSQAEAAAMARKHLSQQRQAITRDTARLREVIATLEGKTRELEARTAGAERVAQLAAAGQTLSDQASRLRAEIERDEKMRAEVQGGLCPILSEKCLNIGEGQTLEGYFKDHLAANRAQLAELQVDGTRAAQAIEAARAAGLALVQLEREQMQLERERALLAEQEQMLAQVDQDFAAQPFVDEVMLNELRSRLTGLDAELIPAREALLHYAGLEGLRQRLNDIAEEGKRKKEDREQLAADAGAVEGLQQDIAAVEARLRALDDPRGRAHALRAEAERETSLRAELQGTHDALNALNTLQWTLEADLQKFSDFDARRADATVRRDRTAAGYREHLTSAALAETVSSRQSAADRADEEATRATHTHAETQAAHESAAAAYDRAEHARARDQLTLVRERAATVAAQLVATHERAEFLAAELARLDEVRLSLREEFRRKERLQSLEETTDFVRDVLKQAGPLVTESYLYNISIEANQLFRDITGEAGRSLRWSRDYEIMIEEGGHERPFLNLSGGEQMAAALAVRLALLKQLSDIRVAFFDEPTVNMDAERRERLAQQIGQVRHFDQLFVISHDDTFEEAVDHVVVLAAREHEATAAVAQS
ncbi:MAG: SMC family ATPase, partial [Casimicrobiaceae bacterium]